MFPKFVLNDMPKPGPGKDFTSGQILYVSINPRDILTDTQWLDFMSAVEYGTRDSISALSSLKSEQSAIDKKLRKLLSDWKDVVADNTGKWNTEMVISKFERQTASLAEMSNIVAANECFVSGHYTALTIDRYNMIALCRFIEDVKFLIKIANAARLAEEAKQKQEKAAAAAAPVKAEDREHEINLARARRPDAEVIVKDCTINLCCRDTEFEAFKNAARARAHLVSPVSAAYQTDT
ncbi:hypothetical protein O3P69_001773 [Scylla paramamosain]|uniref:Uncharacterized protein n=1 Tax=Scylla paramamosain TaxID=85552 RepID=A0AAW0V473_SCYPA